MADKKTYDWLEDPFNDEKTDKELEEAKRSNNRTLLIVLAVVVVFLIGMFASCNAVSVLFGA